MNIVLDIIKSSRFSSTQEGKTGRRLPVKLQMLIVDGKEHFHGKTSNNLINCSKPLQMCYKYRNVHHWSWEGRA